jgi:hypothetical protein
MRRVSIILIAVFGLSFSVFSWQSAKFSGDVNLYIEELQDFMSNVSDQHEILVDHFVQAWEEDSLFSIKEQENIVRLSQKLVKRKARPYPHFVNFLNCLMAAEENQIKQSNYITWIKAMDEFLDKRKSTPGKINTFLGFSNNLFRENAISKTSSTTWVASSSDYDIIIDKEIAIEFNETDLLCYTKIDSIELFNTSGTVYPLEGEWQGNKGRVTWERGGYAPENVFADLSEYTINLRKSEYKAENVTFTNNKYFSEPLVGHIHDKVKQVSSPEKATYPKFYSYTKTFDIEDLYDDVNYSGGLSMQGAKMVGTGDANNLASISLFRNDTLVLTAASLYFGFKADKVVSERTRISIKLKKDSIYHPDLFFDFRTSNRELLLLKTDNFTSQGPYSNSYHKVEMNFDQLVWRIDEDYMRFTAPKGATIGKAYFESANYFNFDKYVDMQMMDNVHPLLSLRSFSRSFMKEEFPVQAYANYLNVSVNQVKHMVMRLAFTGFVYYDSNTEKVTIKPKLHDYIAASVNKIDYDVIGFNSNVESPLENAVFDIRNNDLIINGIPRIQVSDSQNVIIYPRNARIVLKENRNFQFDGTVEAGLITFSGHNLFFDYDSFKINMQSVNIEKMDYLTGDLDNYGLQVVGNINNMIQGLTGDLLIDRNDNKSGRVYYPNYPIFRSRERSYVYYESKNTHGGVYDANDFYFSVDPFEMDSLDNFNAYSMVYEGEFVSAGILPSFREKLSLQEDNSLGFKHETPQEGMPLYGGKGTFNNTIWLSNKGLSGNGTVKYLTSTTWSNDFMFFPDSMNTISQRYQIKKNPTEVEYPRVLSYHNDIHWEPYGDIMWVAKIDTNFVMFNDSTLLAGTLQLEPTGLSGWGKMDLKNSDLHSDWFTYKSEEIFADTSDFFLKSLRAEGYTVLTENVNSHISFRHRSGWFRSNEGFTLVTFPENKYISYIDQFIWDMEGKELAMGAKESPELPDYTNEDIEPEGPRYISTDPKQDSINFVAPLAFYDYEHNMINATGVKFIEIADARIYPDSGLVTVNSNYKLRTFVNSRIKANRFSQYHILHTATVNIESRNDYFGMANYDYIDENGDVQLIHFKEVKVDTGINTIAQGQIFETAEFTLSPVFKFQGKVRLLATDSILTFDGATLIEHPCEELKAAWLDFESRIDPNDIYIPVDANPIDINKMKIFNSMFMYYDSVHVYPAFLSERKSYSDKPMIRPEGYLHYDRSQNLYKIGSKDKINDFALSEDYLSLHREECRLYGEGNVDVGNELGNVTLTNYGTIKHNIEENLTELDLVMAIDFPMNEAMVNLMGNEIDSFPDLKAVNLNRMVHEKAMNAWLGSEKYKAFSDELNLFGTVKSIPSELNKTIILNELKLVWNDVTNSYQSVGQIGIASINGIQINKKVDGFFELRIKRSGDMMDLYLQLDRRNYYYFGYTRGVMQTLSHNTTYVETIMNMKPKDRKSKTPRGSTPYNYLISTDRKKNNFYRRWQDMLSNDEDEPGD